MISLDNRSSSSSGGGRDIVSGYAQIDGKIFDPDVLATESQGRRYGEQAGSCQDENGCTWTWLPFFDNSNVLQQCRQALLAEARGVSAGVPTGNR